VEELFESLRSSLRNARYRFEPILQEKKSRVLIALLVAVVLVALILGGMKACGASEEITYVAAGEASGEQPIAEQKNIVVYVAGEVLRPGVYSLPEGSRINDALQLAGGPTESANMLAINLAAAVSDGMQITIPSLSDSNQSVSATASSSGTQGGSTLVNINTANADQLVSLPGIGEATAQKIIADRTANGPFKSVDDLTRVSGIGEKRLESLRGLICV